MYDLDKSSSDKLILFFPSILLSNAANFSMIVCNVFLTLSQHSNVLPILSMFIDDGKINEDRPNYDEENIKYFEELVNSRYKKYMISNNGRNTSKWNFYPENYIYLRRIKQ